MIIPPVLLRIIPAPLAERLASRLDSPLGGRLASHSLWSFAGSAGSRVLSVAATVAIARILGRHGMGELGILQSTVNMFGILAGFGLNVTATRFVAELRTAYPDRAGRSAALAVVSTLLAGLIAAALLFVAADWLARTKLNAASLAPLLRLNAALLFANAGSGVLTGILFALEVFMPVSVLMLLQGACGMLLMPLGAVWRGTEGVILGQIAATLLMAGAQALVVRRQCRAGRLRFVWSGLSRELHIIWGFALPAFLGNAVIVPFIWLSNTFLIGRESGYEEMGAFAAGLQWFNFLLIVPGLLAQATLPVMSERLGAGDLRAVLKIWAFSLRLNAVVAVALTAGVVLFGPLIMRLYGAAFVGYHGMLGLIALAGAGQAILDSAARLLVLQNRMWALCAMNLGFALACATAAYWFTAGGATGLAAARALAYAVHGCWLSAAVWRAYREMAGARAMAEAPA